MSKNNQHNNQHNNKPTLDLGYLKAKRVVSKQQKDMTVKELMHEMFVSNRTKDKTKPVQELAIMIGNHIVSLNAVIPNADRIAVPMSELSKATQQLELLIKSDHLVSAVQEVLNKLNATKKDEPVKVELEDFTPKANEEPAIKVNTQPNKQQSGAPVMGQVREVQMPKLTPNSDGSIQVGGTTLMSGGKA